MATIETIKLSKNGSAQWTSLNPILEDKEIGVEVDTKLFKVGNGIARWNDLAYVVSGGKNALFIFLSDDPDNMLGLTSDGGIFLDKKAFNGLAAYTAGKEQGASAPTPPDEYNATLMRIGKDAHDIFAQLVLVANKIADLEGRKAGDSIDDAVTATTSTWSSHKTNDAILAAQVALKADITNNPNGAYDALVRLAQFLEDNDSMAVTIAEELASTVRFSVVQTLTDAHKKQARDNIGAAGTDDIGDTSNFLQTYLDASQSATGSQFEKSEM
jgi:hypothetical protein